MIYGIIPLRNVIRLEYPWKCVIRCLSEICEHVIVSVDPSSVDQTDCVVRAFVAQLNHTGMVVVDSVWDTSNTDGMLNNEITVQTDKLLEHVPAQSWVLSLQADELIHESQYELVQQTITEADSQGVTGISLERLYFYHSLDTIRRDWTQLLCRIVKHKSGWRPDRDGAMKFEAIPGTRVNHIESAIKIYHYSRLGSPEAIARRIRNLDSFFHHPNELIPESEVEPYDFQLRGLDTYLKERPESPLLDGVLEQFHGSHPRVIAEC